MQEFWSSGKIWIFSKWEVLNMLIDDRYFEVINPHLLEDWSVSSFNSRGV